METKSIGRLISILHRQALVYLHHALKDFDIGSTEYIFLIALFKDNGLTQEQLSERIFIDKAATARAIKSLEEKGYVRREVDASDKRAKKVYYTEKAERCKPQILTVLKNWTGILTEDLDQDTLKMLTDSLEKMSGKVRSMDLKKLLQKE